MSSRRFVSTLIRTFSDAAIQKKAEFELKYAHKLSLRLKEEGVSSITEFREKMRKDNNVNLKRIGSDIQATSLKPSKTEPKFTNASPIKPLCEIMNLNKITTTPHSPDEVANIWNGYHSIKRGGTGHGYISATIPASLLSSLVHTARQFPRFIVPLERTSDNQSTGHEFFFLEWTFHRLDDGAEQAVVMFTPLQQYKIRQEFSQPYLVMTCYSDLIPTHQIGLMRGEITSSPNRLGEFLLSQSEAQMLAIELQKFYLAKDGQAARRVLETFHRNKAEFRWEELLSV